MDFNELIKNDYFKNVDVRHDFDGLTKVLNRDIILGYLNHLIGEKIPFTVALCDIDNLKYINDTYGHLMGDRALVKFADCLATVLGVRGVTGRYGGDEFMVILPNIVGYDEIWNIFHELNGALAEIDFPGMPDLEVSATTGITRFPKDGSDFEQLMKTADKALYRGKSKGRNCFIIYLPEKHANIDVTNTINKSFNSMEMIAKVFNILASDADFTSRVETLFNFLSSYLQIEDLMLQTDALRCYEFTAETSRNKKFGYINSKDLEDKMNSNGLVFINTRRHLLQISANSLFDQLTDANVMALVAVKITCAEKDYGILLAITTTNRSWQPDEMDLIIVAARVMGMILYKDHKTLEDYYKI